MIQIKVGRNSYNSISAAWRALSPRGLPMITVRWRLKHGWDVRDAFLIPAIPPQKRRGFAEIRDK